MSLRWYGHSECMANDGLAKKIYDDTVKGTRRRGRSLKRRIHTVREEIKVRDVSNDDARVLIWDRMYWKNFVYRGGAYGGTGLT